MKLKSWADLETKLTQLDLAVEKSKTLLSAGKRLTLSDTSRRYKKLLTRRMSIDGKPKPLKLVKGRDFSNSGMEFKLRLKTRCVDVAIENLQKFLADAEKAEKFETHEEELRRERSLHENRLKMQAELSTTSLTNTDTKELSSSSTKTKLPKLSYRN